MTKRRRSLDVLDEESYRFTNAPAIRERRRVATEILSGLIARGAEFGEQNANVIERAVELADALIVRLSDDSDEQELDAESLRALDDAAETAEGRKADDELVAALAEKIAQLVRKSPR